MQTGGVKVAASLLLAVMVVLWASPAFAGIGGQATSALGALGGGGASGGIESFYAMVSGKMAMLGSIGILGVGAVLLLSRSDMMMLVGGMASMIGVLVIVSWAAANTGSFFGAGGLLP